MIAALSKKEWWLLGGLLLVFLLVRLPGLHQPYHQDEYKLAFIVEEGSAKVGGITHPPLNELTYRAADRLFGNDNLRFVPLIFSLINAILLFFFVRWRYGLRAAYWALTFFAVAYYSVLSSVMADIDGAVLPFIFLCAAFVYYRAVESASLRSAAPWVVGFVALVAAGFLMKLSFVVTLGAFVFDYAIMRRRSFTLRQGGLFLLGCAAIALLCIGVILLVQYLVPAFNITRSATYWKNFIRFADRNYFQTLIQLVKALLYVSPLLLLPLALMRREDWARLRLYFCFLGTGLVFYLVLFDFSSGALDRYLQFMVVPLAVIGGALLARVDFTEVLRRPANIVLGLILPATLLFMVQLLPHAVPPLHPKTEWITRLLALKWNFLFPFSGGSGPLGFYVSFLLIALAFLLGLALAIWLWRRSRVTPWAVAGMLALGLTYNLAFIGEYQLGLVNGHSATLLPHALAYIREANDIPTVITYNDIGTYELTHMGKHKQRLYVAPMFEEGNRETLRDYYGDYLVLDIPRLNPEGFQAKFFATCAVKYEDRSRAITARVYDCRNGDRSLIP
ncbi:MAG: hypothetical protein A2542_01750 [Parcubacteria group bacterium RIFOXYD2_FULL_52_8]|nr:MAG: hypothetical protein A2542_01750 [Parcubacteria group bacterium RIFOXYD2_FULL_52_8]